MLRDKSGSDEKIFISYPFGGDGWLGSTPPALDMDKAVFYIPEEKKFEAEERFCSRTSPVWSIILYALLLGAAFAALSFAAPKLIGAFTSVFNR